MTEFLRDEMRKAIRDGSRKPLIVCGAGVSSQATNQVAPSWEHLIKSGIRRVSDLDANLASWAEASEARLRSGGAAEWITVADEVTDKLGGAHNAEFSAWLGSEIGNLTAVRNDLLDAIIALDCPIATTNYDDILAKASDLTVISWTDHANTLQFLTGDYRGVLHLHGHWRTPKDVVLGLKSYDEQSNDSRRELLQQMATLDRPTIFIGCSPDGLSDPDFSRLDQFLEKWADAAQRRYLLVRQGVTDDGTEKPLPSAEPSRRLYAAAYGVNFDDLAPYLRGLAPPHKTHPASPSMPDINVKCIDQHEPNPEIFGREAEIETIVEALLSDKPALVSGGPGMGKTAVATAALYDPRIVERFGRYRIFASLESDLEPRALLARIVEGLGLPPTGDDVSLLRNIEIQAEAQPVAVILDNAETVFETKPDEAERLLKLVAQIAGLSVVTTLRGVSPALPGAAVIDDLAKLEPAAAQQAFIAVSGDALGADPDLRHLLEALDGHALSIRLVAAQASGLAALKGLRESWDEAHADILRRPGTEETRLTSVRASLALSLNCQRIRTFPLARRLLAVLAFLPGGLAEDDVRRLLGSAGALTKTKSNDAIVCLQQLRLVERRPDRRLRMLTPLRECVKSDIPIMAQDRKRLVNRYLLLAAKADNIGSTAWEQVRGLVEAEADNLDPVCKMAVETDIGNKFLMKGQSGLAKFHRFTGRASVASIHRAVELLRTKSLTRMLPNCLHFLGTVEFSRSNPKAALAHCSEALALYRRIGDVIGEANCLYILGDSTLLRSDHETALARFSEALALFRSAGGLHGEASCLYALGRIALRGSDQETALAQISEARELYRCNDLVLGEANCSLSLGQIAFQRSDHKTALVRFSEALALYRQIGDVKGEANYFNFIGELALQRSDHETALARFSEALALYRSVGDLHGEANCLYFLGDIALQRSDHETALAHFSEAMELYRRAEDQFWEAYTMVRRGLALRGAGEEVQGLTEIESGFAQYFSIVDAQDHAHPGWVAIHQALTCADEAEAGRHRETARAAWTGIGRLDLVHHWID